MRLDLEQGPGAHLGGGARPAGLSSPTRNRPPRVMIRPPVRSLFSPRRETPAHAGAAGPSSAAQPASGTAPPKPPATLQPGPDFLLIVQRLTGEHQPRPPWRLLA